MIFEETKLKGAFVIRIEKREDERGFFARAWCQKEFEAHGLKPQFVQVNLASSRKRGTLRGMHYQVSPYQEAKLIRCTKGAVYDVIIDLRPCYCVKQGVSMRLLWPREMWNSAA